MPIALQLILHYLRLVMELLRVAKPPVHDRDELDGADDPLLLEPPVEQPAVRALPLPPPTEVADLPVAVATDKPRALASATIHEGRLVGDKVIQVPSKRHSSLLPGKPVILLWHWTSTIHGTALTMAKRIQALAKGDQRSGSVHFWIEGNGDIFQSVPTNRASWHASSKTAARFKKVGGRWVIDPTRSTNLSVNPLSIGVELVNVGEVRLMRPGATGSDPWVPAKVGDAKAVFMGWPYGRRDKETGKIEKGPIVKDAMVRDAVDRDGRRRFYHIYTPAQIEAAERLTRALVDEYGLDRAACSWGHIDVDGTRKVDPGPLWFNEANPAILDRVFGGRS